MRRLDGPASSALFADPLQQYPAYSNLTAIIAQRLLARKDEAGRIVAVEAVPAHQGGLVGVEAAMAAADSPNDLRMRLEGLL